jgi:hypothetical protein
MIEADKKVLRQGTREKYLMIQMQRFAALEAWSKCSNSSKPAKTDPDVCEHERKELSDLEESERELEVEIIESSVNG